MQFQTWKLRIILLLYIIYKMLLSAPVPSLSTIFQVDELAKKTGGEYAGHIAGTILVIVLFGSMFASVFFYHIKQGISEFRNDHIFNKRRFRLFTIIFTGIFYTIAGMSLFNTGSNNAIVLLELSSWLNFYTMFTLISIVAAFSTIATDFQVYRKSKQLSKSPEYDVKNH